MNQGLKPYPSYQSSGSERIGVFPAHWRVERAKVLLKEVDERSTSGDEELLSVSHKTGVTPRREKNVTMFMAESNAGHKLCRPGDVVINTMWAWMAAVGVSRNSGLVSPSYGVYRPRISGLLQDQYLDEMLRTPPYRDEFLVRSTGITSSRLRLYPDEFLKIPLPVPPPDEQTAIMRYLNHADNRILRYARAKQGLIRLLFERRDNITESALRFSNGQGRRIGNATERIARAIDRVDEEIYTPIGLYNRGRGIFHKAPTEGSDLGDSTFYWITNGDLVLSGQFAWEGAIALAREKDEGCIASHRYPILQGKAEMLESAFLLSFRQTGWGQLLLNHHSRGAAGRNRPLNVNSLMKEKVPIPPLPSQKQIGDLVHSESLLRDAVAGLTARLSEYRIRLVTEVITGMVDVREAAASLRDELHDTDDKLLAEEDIDGGDEEELVDEEVVA